MTALPAAQRWFSGPGPLVADAEVPVLLDNTGNAATSETITGSWVEIRWPGEVTLDVLLVGGAAHTGAGNVEFQTSQDNSTVWRSLGQIAIAATDDGRRLAMVAPVMERYVRALLTETAAGNIQAVVTVTPRYTEYGGVAADSTDKTTAS